MSNEFLEFLFVAAPLSAGLRYYGREFLPQFSVAAVISVGAQATHHQQTFGHPANLWLLALFAVLAIFMGSAAYWMDKRFKITHWEKNPD
jgi:hypothetical protein